MFLCLGTSLNASYPGLSHSSARSQHVSALCLIQIIYGCLFICADAGISACVYLVQLLLLSRQIDRSRTPAGLSRVSLWTFLAQSIVDSVSFAGHITFAILANGRPSLSLVAPAFVACVLFALESVSAFTVLYITRLECLLSNMPFSLTRFKHLKMQ